MIKTLLFSVIVAVASATVILQEDFSTIVPRAKIATEVNAMKTSWTAAVSSRFENATYADIKRMLGTILPGEPGYMGPDLERTHFKTADSAIPESFDVRTAWPACAAVTGRVRDQSSCGSCWAFGSTEAFNDRFCISTGDAKTIFSAEDTNACCTGVTCSMSMGCNGGQPSGAWNWFTKVGVSTGEDFADVGKGLSCKPYSLQSCAHHVDPPEGMVSCTTLNFKTPSCTATCSESNYATLYTKDKHFATSSYSIKTVANIQKEIMEKGTVSVAMTVYEDFETYSSGVYKHVTGKSLGGHAIKMVGWGVDNGTPYWTCVNSWNDSWGERGQFRILRGSNECGIEGSVVAGDV